MKSELELSMQEFGIEIVSKYKDTIKFDINGRHFFSDIWENTFKYKEKECLFESESWESCRTLAPGVVKKKYSFHSENDVASNVHQALDKGMLVLKNVNGVVVGPRPGSVMVHFLENASANYYSFEDWISNFNLSGDYSDLTIKYMNRREVTKPIIDMIGWDILKVLVKKEHENVEF